MYAPLQRSVLSAVGLESAGVVAICGGSEAFHRDTVKLIRYTGADASPARISEWALQFAPPDKFGGDCAATSPCAPPRDVVTPAVAAAGVQVCRGPDWLWGGQDDSSPGVLVRETEAGWWTVRWRNGVERSYRIGHQGKHDLTMAPRHRLLSILMDSVVRLLSFELFATAHGAGVRSIFFARLRHMWSLSRPLV